MGAADESVAPVVSIDAVIEAVASVLAPQGRLRSELRAETPLAEIGLESVDYIEIFIALEDLLGWEIDTSHEYDFAVIGDLTGVRLRCPLGH